MSRRRSATKISKENLCNPERRKGFTVCVIECDRVGLTLAWLFAEAGFKVIGVDVNHNVTGNPKNINLLFSSAGIHSFFRNHSKMGRFTITKDTRSACSVSDVIILVVSAPFDAMGKPDYSQVERVCKEVGMGLRSDSLIFFQTTMGLGIIETLARKTLEEASGLVAGKDFGLAFSPILLTSDNILNDTVTNVRFVGAINEQSLEVACDVLGTIIKGKIIKVSTIRTAECAKIFRDTYMAANIALANELVQFCERTGIDFLEARNAANTIPNCHLQLPQIILRQTSDDSGFLANEAEEVNVKLGVLTQARKTNTRMFNHALHLTRDALRSCGKTLGRAKIAILGVSRRPNVKEPQGSLSKKLASHLKKKGAVVQVYDPHFSCKELVKLGYRAKKTLVKTVEGVDCIIIAVGHDKFRRLNLGKIKILAKNPISIVDIERIIDPNKAEKKGFIYRGLGKGLELG